YLGVRYLDQLEYKDEKTARILAKKHAKAWRKGWIIDRQKWLGHYYGAGLAGKSHPDLIIAWVDPYLGYGVFAEKMILKRTYIGEYTGVLRKRRWWGRWENLYCFDYTIG